MNIILFFLFFFIHDNEHIYSVGFHRRKERNICYRKGKIMILSPLNKLHIYHGQAKSNQTRILLLLRLVWNASKTPFIWNWIFGACICVCRLLFCSTNVDNTLTNIKCDTQWLSISICIEDMNNNSYNKNPYFLYKTVVVAIKISFENLWI